MKKTTLAAMLLVCGFLAEAQNRFSTLDQWLEDNIKVLGGRAVLMVYKDGKLVYSRSENELTRRQKLVGRMIAKRQGKSASEAVRDFDEDTRQLIASCSKWLSAALVMTFVDEGKLNITDTIGKFLPVMTANGKGHITIWQCLSHLTGINQSGIGEKSKIKEGGRKTGGLKKLKRLGSEMSPMDEVIDSIAQLAMEGEPGKTFHYGNAGLQIAAGIIEKVSGKDFETLFQERIAKPCEMTNTDFGKAKTPLAAGGAWSTANDYMHFLQMILNKGTYKGNTVLSEKSITAMQVNYAKDAKVVYSPAEAANWGYGFGEWIMADASKERADAVSSAGLFGSFPWVNNERGYCAMLFTFNIKNKGRHELYASLKDLVDKTLSEL